MVKPECSAACWLQSRCVCRPSAGHFRGPLTRRHQQFSRVPLLANSILQLEAYPDSRSFVGRVIGTGSSGSVSHTQLQAIQSGHPVPIVLLMPPLLSSSSPVLYLRDPCNVPFACNTKRVGPCLALLATVSVFPSSVGHRPRDYPDQPTHPPLTFYSITTTSQFSLQEPWPRYWANTFRSSQASVS